MTRINDTPTGTAEFAERGCPTTWGTSPAIRPASAPRSSR